MASTGRNDPCPCGSGRTFKHCCLRAREADDASRMRLRTTEGALIPLLFAYAESTFGDEFVSDTWDEFFLWSCTSCTMKSSPALTSSASSSTKRARATRAFS